jgi:hypothetical protein
MTDYLTGNRWLTISLAKSYLLTDTKWTWSAKHIGTIKLLDWKHTYENRDRQKSQLPRTWLARNVYTKPPIGWNPSMKNTDWPKLQFDETRFAEILARSSLTMLFWPVISSKLTFFWPWPCHIQDYKLILFHMILPSVEALDSREQTSTRRHFGFITKHFKWTKKLFRQTMFG